MIKKLSSRGGFICLSILVLMLLAPLTADAATQYFFDDFESYSLNSYPTSFTQIYNGSGDADQKVISTTGPDASPTQVFQLVGRSSWASEHIWTLPATLPATLVIQAYIMPVNGQWPGRFGLRNTSGAWGTRVSAVLFDTGGNITALQNGSDSDKVQLGTYTMNTWYLVRMEHHIAARTYDVYINGVKVGTDIPMHPTLAPTQLHLTAANLGTTDTIYFDDVGVYDSDPTTSIPTVTTQAVTDIGTTTATGNGTITDLGAPNPTQHGVCWNTTGTPTIADNATQEGAVAATGAFTSAMTGLSENTTYHVRAYATNSAGTAYGGEVSFTTLRSPGVTVGALSSSTTSEDGGSATFTVVLDSSPSADVHIPLTSSDASEGTVSASSLTFTSANWDTAQTVTVTGVNDQLLDGDIVYTVEIGPAVSGDSDYDGIDPPDKTLTNSDNDVDTDNDGLSDEMEGDGDHDGDGVVDSQDYDPTGYLYDSATGKIVPGGRISVSDPAHVAFVSGRDGSDGYYQFVVDQPGIYTITVTPPPGYIVNQRHCPTSGTLIADGTSTPLIVGSNEDGATGYLADYSCNANQWYLVLDIQDTTPLLVNNNIPLLSRGSIPAMNEWGVGILTSLLALAALAILRRRSGV